MLMKCCSCLNDFNEHEMEGKGNRYCQQCFEEKSIYMKSRKMTLSSLKALPLEAKIIKSKIVIEEAVNEFGIEHIYLSYSGGKDSTVLSHIVRQLYPNILHIFSNTTNEYPETISHINWEVTNNSMNLAFTKPIDKYGQSWNFKRVVDEHGYPMFTKRIANAIRTFRRAQTDTTRANSIQYMQRIFPKYIQYNDCNISDKCCDKLKKTPLRQLARKLKMECAIIGTLAEESRQREVDWLNNGCNIFYKRKDNQCRPLSFWTEEDIYAYIKKYDVKISDLYSLGYERNGCMFCGFGIEYESIKGTNRFERLAITHPKMHKYLVNNFRDILDQCNIKY